MGIKKYSFIILMMISIVLDGKTVESLETNYQIKTVGFFEDSFSFKIPTGVLSFYTKNEFPYPSKLDLFLDEIRLEDYDTLITQVRIIREKYKFDGFATSLLTKNLIQVLFPDLGQDEIELFQWFFLNELCYDVVLGYGVDNSVILYNSDEEFSHTKYYVIEGAKYYQIFSPQKVITDLNYFSLKEEEVLYEKVNLGLGISKLRHSIEERDLNFWFEGKNYRITFACDKSLVQFLAKIPNVYWSGKYFNYGTSSVLKESLRNSLYPHLKLLTEDKQLEFLLAFSQNIFQYERNDPYLEEWLFPEEAFYRLKGDCEDTALAFAFLVDEFLDFKTAVLCHETLDGEGHLNVGILKGGKYIICEPSAPGKKCGEYDSIYDLNKATVYLLDSVCN